MVRNSVIPELLADPKTAEGVQAVLKINQETLKKVEKPFWASKKFIAFASTMALFFVMFMYAMSVLGKEATLGWPLATAILALVFAMTFVAVAFNLTQAKVDSLNRGFAMLGGFAQKIPGAKKED
jgi:Fe2+ transport system protein B